jgi:hypothetical protein
MVTAIDPAETIFRVRLDDFRCDQMWWTRIFNSNPYKPSTEVATDPLPLTELETTHLCLRGDWFINATQQAPLYYDLLQLPKTDRELEQRLGIDSKADLQDTIVNSSLRRMLRVGVALSGIAQCNRLLERHSIAKAKGTRYADWSNKSLPAYWKTYDFDDDREDRNLFRYPLGPGDGRGSPFNHNGGEIVFHLPNGLVAFMVIDSLGNRWDASPIRTHGTHLAESIKSRPDAPAARSCMSCHSSGTEPASDSLGGYIKGHESAFPKEVVQAVMGMHSNGEVVKQVMDTDANIFKAARKRAWLGAEYQDNHADVSMYTYEMALDRRSVAAELSISIGELEKNLANCELYIQAAVGPLIEPEGQISRERFSGVFSQIVSAWKLKGR